MNQIPEIRVFLRLCSYAVPAWIALRCARLLLCRPRRRFQPVREIAMGLFAIFMCSLLVMALDGKWSSPAIMLEQAFTRLQTGEKIHPLPFHTIGQQLRGLPHVTPLTQLLGNTFMFTPWGFCLPLMWRRFRTPGRMIVMSLGLTCFIEFTQLFIDRYVELDDILLNFLGAMLGAGLWWLVHLIAPKTDNCFLKA